MSLIVRDAKTAYSYLNGVFSIYKATKTPYNRLISALKNSISSGMIIEYYDLVLSKLTFFSIFHLQILIKWKRVQQKGF